MSNVFITGANGLLGQHLVEFFSQVHKVLASDLGPDPSFLFSHVRYEPVDILDEEKLSSLTTSFKPDLIINAAAYSDVDGCEIDKQKAWGVNVKAIENLIEICKKEKTKLIHISSDYVFDGRDGPYSEDDRPNPISYYGQTKLESELKIKASGIGFLIVRTNVLYGIAERVNPNFFTWVFNKLKNDERIRVVTDQFNNPALVDDLARAILELTSKKFSGSINIAGSEYLSRYDFAQKIAEEFELDKNKIDPVKTEDLRQKAPRPFKGGLRIDLARKTLKTDLSGINKGLKHVRKEMML